MKHILALLLFSEVLKRLWWKERWHPSKYVSMFYTEMYNKTCNIYIFITWIIYCELQRLKKRFQCIFSSSTLEGKCPLKSAHHENGMCSEISWKFKKWELCSCVYGLRLSRRGQVPFWPSCKLWWAPQGVTDNSLHPDKAPHSFEPNGCRCTVIRSYMCKAHRKVLLTPVFWIRQKKIIVPKL